MAGHGNLVISAVLAPSTGRVTVNYLVVVVVVYLHHPLVLPSSRSRSSRSFSIPVFG